MRNFNPAGGQAANYNLNNNNNYGQYNNFMNQNNNNFQNAYNNQYNNGNNPNYNKWGNSNNNSNFQNNINNINGYNNNSYQNNNYNGYNMNMNSMNNMNINRMNMNSMNNMNMNGMNMNSMNNMNAINGINGMNNINNLNNMNMNKMNMNSMNNNYSNMNNMGNVNNMNCQVNNNINNNISKMNMNSISFSNNGNMNNQFNQNLNMNNINNQNQLNNNNQYNNNNNQDQALGQNNYQPNYNQVQNQVQNNNQYNNNFNQNNINMNNASFQPKIENNNNSNQNNNNEIEANCNNGDKKDIDDKDGYKEKDNEEMIDEDNNNEKDKHINNLDKKNNNSRINKNKNDNKNNIYNNFNYNRNKPNNQKKPYPFKRIQDGTSNRGINSKYTNNRMNTRDTKIYNNPNLMNNQQKNNNNTNNINNNVKQQPKNNRGNANKDSTENKRKNRTNLNPKTTVTFKQEKVDLDFYVRARGLDNVGATCYMNATLQCFYHVKALSEHLINNNKIKPKLELTFCYKDLVEELVGCKNRRKFNIDRNNYTNNEQIKESIKPTKFKDLISEMNPLFKGVKANDSKDLIIFLLETMNAELTQMNNNTDKMEPFYGDNKEDMEPEKFKKFHNSIISDIFYGFQKGIIKCDQCEDESVTYSIINLLVFPLEKIYTELNKEANNNNNNNMNMNNYGQNNMNRFNNFNYGFNYSNQFNNFRNGMNNNLNALNPSTIQPRQRGMIKKENPKLTFDECFTDLNKAEILTGQNAIYCNKCKGMRNAKMFNEIIKAPNVLIIILNRGKGNTFECDVDYPSSLDLSKYIKEPSSIKQYELIGVISHLGKSSMEGHFIAYCRHFDFSWYLFNDSIVKQVGGESDFKGIPYILFYQNKQWN